MQVSAGYGDSVRHILVANSDGVLASDGDVASVGVAAEARHVVGGLAQVLLSEREFGEDLPGGVLEADGRRTGHRAVRGLVAGLEVGELEDVLADLDEVRGVTVQRVDRPARVGGGEGERLAGGAGDLDGGDLADVKFREELSAVRCGRPDGVALAAEVGEADEDGGRAGENDEFLRSHVGSVPFRRADLASARPACFSAAS